MELSFFVLLVEESSSSMGCQFRVCDTGLGYFVSTEPSYTTRSLRFIKIHVQCVQRGIRQDDVSEPNENFTIAFDNGSHYVVIVFQIKCYQFF